MHSACRVAASPGDERNILDYMRNWSAHFRSHFKFWVLRLFANASMSPLVFHTSADTHGCQLHQEPLDLPPGFFQAQSWRHKLQRLELLSIAVYSCSIKFFHSKAALGWSWLSPSRPLIVDYAIGFSKPRSGCTTALYNFEMADNGVEPCTSTTVIRQTFPMPTPHLANLVLVVSYMTAQLPTGGIGLHQLHGTCCVTEPIPLHTKTNPVMDQI